MQTFGHKYGGFIYAFLFSGDIINNLITALMSRVRQLTLISKSLIIVEHICRR